MGEIVTTTKCGIAFTRIKGGEERKTYCREDKLKLELGGSEYLDGRLSHQSWLPMLLLDDYLKTKIWEIC